MTELNVYTSNCFTDLTSAAIRTNNQHKGFAEMQSLYYTVKKRNGSESPSHSFLHILFSDYIRDFLQRDKCSRINTVDDLFELIDLKVIHDEINDLLAFL